jgi:sugar/nucleoside kinase (ribokinase family)
VRVTTLGDLLLDVIVRSESPLVPGDDQMAETSAGPGGQAANVAAWAAELGAQARFVGHIGDDVAGRVLVSMLRERGVDVVGPVAGRTGTVVSVAAAGDRTMVSDRGAAPELSPRDLEPAWFDCDVLHISGYSLLLDPIASAAELGAAHARDHGARVSVDVSTFTLVDDAFRARVAALAPDLVFATERERQALGGLETRWVVKRGKDGVHVDGVDHPAVAGSIVDTTGAGDAFAAGFLVGGAHLGLETAARCCAKTGAMP